MPPKEADGRCRADQSAAEQWLVIEVVAAMHAQNLLINGHLRCVQEAAGEDIRLVRVMPNTPCLVGETASAMCLGGKASEEDAEEVRTLFSSVGRIVQVRICLRSRSSIYLDGLVALTVRSYHQC